jgi:hypothetical protein
MDAMFSNKAGAYLSGATIGDQLFSLLGNIRLAAWEKNLSLNLLCLIISDEEKSFTKLTEYVNVTQLYPIVTMLWR